MAKSQSNKTKKKEKTTVKSINLTQQPSWWINSRLHTWGIFLLGFLLYANTFTHDYTQDDAIVIYDNMFTTEGVAGIPGILQYDTFYGFFKEAGKDNLVTGGRYRPFSLILFAIEVQLFGQNPVISHIINALFFGLTCVVLYWLILQLLASKKNQTYIYFMALSTSLLFAVHSIHTEVVANIKGRDEILALLGSLAALYFLIIAYRKKKNNYLAVAGVAFFCALLSKENAITFLAIIPLSFYFFTKAKTNKVVSLMMPILIGTALFLLIRTSILGFNLGETSMELMNNPFIKIENNQYKPFTTGEKFATVTYTLGKYVQLLFVPYPLTHDYYPRHIDKMSWSDWRVLTSLIFYIFLVGYAIRGLLRKDPISYGILFFLASLSIVSNILFPVGTHMAERLAFMPSVGYCFVLAILLYRLAALMAPQKKLNSFRQLYPSLGAILVISILYSWITLDRNTVWKDNFTLFTSDIERSPNSAKLRNATGGALFTRASETTDETQRKKYLTEAIGHLEEAIRLHPNYKNPYLLLGNCYNYLKDYEKSVQFYRKALEIDPSYKDAQNNIGITYREAGRYYGEELGDLNKALDYLKKAYQIRPDEYETVRLLGVANGVKGNTVEAVEFFLKGTQLRPEDANAWLNLGNAYFNLGNTEKGKEAHQKAQAINPQLFSGQPIN